MPLPIYTHESGCQSDLLNQTCGGFDEIGEKEQHAVALGDSPFRCPMVSSCAGSVDVLVIQLMYDIVAGRKGFSARAGARKIS